MKGQFSRLFRRRGFAFKLTPASYQKLPQDTPIVKFRSKLARGLIGHIYGPQTPFVNLDIKATSQTE